MGQLCAAEERLEMTTVLSMLQVHYVIALLCCLTIRSEQNLPMTMQLNISNVKCYLEMELIASSQSRKYSTAECAIAFAVCVA